MEPTQPPDPPDTPPSEVWARLPSKKRSRAVSILIRMAYQLLSTLTKDHSDDDSGNSSATQDTVEAESDTTPPAE